MVINILINGHRRLELFLSSHGIDANWRRLSLKQNANFDKLLVPVIVAGNVEFRHSDKLSNETRILRMHQDFGDCRVLHLDELEDDVSLLSPRNRETFIRFRFDLTYLTLQFSLTNPNVDEATSYPLDELLIVRHVGSERPDRLGHDLRPP